MSIDKFEYSHYLIAGYCMVIIARSYVLITCGSKGLRLLPTICLTSEKALVFGF